MLNLASDVFAANLTRAEVAIVTMIFVVLAVLITILVLKMRDQALAKQTPAVPQRWTQTVATAPTPPTGITTAAPPLVIPGYCPNCGMATPPMARFCEKCGHRLLQG